MKTLITLSFLSLVIFTSQAQDNRFEKTMQKHIHTLDTLEATSTLQDLANKFERISNAEQDEWLPAYYAAYCYINLARRAGQENGEKADQLLDKAAEFVATAKDRGGEESEMLTLDGYIAQMRIMADPMTRGQKYGPVVYEKLSMAMSVNEENPRPHMLMGINLMYTPEQFGGSAARAKPHLEKAVALYENENSETLAPHWGSETATYMMKECERKLGE